MEKRICALCGYTNVIAENNGISGCVHCRDRKPKTVGALKALLADVPDDTLFAVYSESLGGLVDYHVMDSADFDAYRDFYGRELFVLCAEV